VKTLHLTITVFLFSIIVFLTFDTNQYAYACSCASRGGPSPSEAFEKSTAVFSGEVIEIDKNDSSNIKTVKFDVQRVWKGVSGNQTTVITGSGDANCGYPFVMNETYLIYAVGDPLYTQSCGRNTLFADSYDDLRVLGPGTEVPEFPFTIPILLVSIASLIVFYRIQIRK